MNENKGGTPLKPYEVGQKVWNRVIEKVCTVRGAYTETRRHPRDEGVVTFYTYTLEEVGAVWQHHQLALKDPSAPMFQSGDEVPSTSMRRTLEWYARASLAELMQDGGDLAREVLNAKV